MMLAMAGMTRAGHRVGTTTQVPLLFLISDTGGGHRSAATAVGQALDRLYPGEFAPLLCDPLGGAGSAWLLRRVAALYGPAIRLAPWLWGAAYHVSDSRAAMAMLDRTLLRLAGGPAARAAASHRPAAIVSFHPLTGSAAVRARDRTRAGGCGAVPVVTVITDLPRAHAAWHQADADLVITPPAAGPPVTIDFWDGPALPAERAKLRRSLGLSEDRFVILLTGGAEGSGGMFRRARQITRRFADVEVAVICGRNRRLRRRLEPLAARLAAGPGGRLTVTGLVDSIGDWLRCADLVVGKAGPGTITEAACCGTPLLLTSHVPGQEAGNAELVTAAGAGLKVAGVRGLLAGISRLRDDPAALEAMRTASARLGRTRDTLLIAERIASLARAVPGAAAGSGIAAIPGARAGSCCG
jgi:1,2-diacylglycerol 3-beta-galactosyltransferase